MHDDTNRIIRGTFCWGIGTTLAAAILRALGTPIEPFAVGVGASYALGGIYFYAITVAALFGKPGAIRRFALWLPVKIALLIVLVLFARDQTKEGIFSLIAGSIVFIPAAFRYAVEESRRVETDDSSGDDPPPQGA